MRIDELRANPDLNPRVSILDTLAKYKHRHDVYVSFTSINKLGINPQSDYATPIGIYAYPLKQIWEAMKPHKGHDTMVGMVPFAGDQPHVILFTCPKQEGFISDFTKYKTADLDRDLEKLREIVYQQYTSNTPASLQTTISGMTPERANEAIRSNANYTVTRYSELAAYQANSKRPIGILWYVTYKISQDMGRERGTIRRDASSARVWNALLRKMGFKGFSDTRGLGIIHANEPTQAVFLTTGPLKVIGVFDNKTYPQDMVGQKRDQGKFAFAFRGWKKRGDLFLTQALGGNLNTPEGHTTIANGIAAWARASAPPMYGSWRDLIMKVIMDEVGERNILPTVTEPGTAQAFATAFERGINDSLGFRDSEGKPLINAVIAAMEALQKELKNR